MDHRTGMDDAIERFATSRYVVRTPGALYISSRGIPPELAVQSAVRYGRINSRMAVLFPARDERGQLMGIAARFLTVAPDQPKAVHCGPIGLGVFATPAALTAPQVAICLAPFDALSLAAAGLPAVALLGTSCRPEWLRSTLSCTQVLIATNADSDGDAVAESLTRWLRATAEPVRLRPPDDCKDWNRTLLAHGRAGVATMLPLSGYAAAPLAAAAQTVVAAARGGSLGDSMPWSKMRATLGPDTPTYHAALAVAERLWRTIDDLHRAADVALDADTAARFRAGGLALQCGPLWDVEVTLQQEVDALQGQPAEEALAAWLD